MASAHIEIGTSARLGAQLRGLVDALQSAQNQVVHTKEVYDQIALGGDWVALGTALGLTGASAATDAEAIYNLVGSVAGEIETNATFTNQLLSRLG